MDSKKTKKNHSFRYLTDRWVIPSKEKSFIKIKEFLKVLNDIGFSLHTFVYFYIYFFWLDGLPQ